MGACTCEPMANKGRDSGLNLDYQHFQQFPSFLINYIFSRLQLTWTCPAMDQPPLNQSKMLEAKSEKCDI